MSITIRTSSRLSNIDTNNNSDTTENGERHVITAADRAARRAKRAERLALQKQESEGEVFNGNGNDSGSGNDDAAVKVGGSTSVTINPNKNAAITMKLTKNDDASEVKVASVNNHVNGNHEKSDEPSSPGPPPSPKPAVNVLSNALSNMMSDEKKTPGQSPRTFGTASTTSAPGPRPASSTGGVRGRINTWAQGEKTAPKQLPKYGAAAGPSKFSFGTDYTKKATESNSATGLRSSSTGSSTGLRSTGGVSNGLRSTGSPFTPAPNKYTPTVNRTPPRPASTNFSGGGGSGGRWQGIQKDEPSTPSFGNQSASDRMAHFREAMEKEKAQKAREEEREKKKQETLEKRKLEEEKRKVAEAQKKAEEEADRKRAEEKAALEAKAAEEEANAIPDSEKVKHMPACKKKKEKKPARRTMSISNIVLDWVQEMTKDYPVEIRNFSASWNDGMAFCALIHRFNPDAFDFSELSPENKRHNFDLAFETGKKVKDIPILLDTEDMVRMARPEPRSVQCYIQWIWSVYGPTSGYGPTPQEVQNAVVA